MPPLKRVCIRYSGDNDEIKTWWACGVEVFLVKQKQGLDVVCYSPFDHTELERKRRLSTLAQIQNIVRNDGDNAIWSRVISFLT